MAVSLVRLYALTMDDVLAPAATRLRHLLNVLGFFSEGNQDMDKLENLREYLRHHEISNMRANVDEPFAFICYAHNDSEIVHRCAVDLYRKGYNLWIDVANLPLDEHSWEDAAFDALSNDNCRQLLFFRSKDAVTRPAVAAELERACGFGRLRGNVICVDVGSETEQHGMDAFFTALERGELSCDEESVSAARSVFDIVQPDNNALSITSPDAVSVRTLTRSIIALPQASQFMHHTDYHDLMLPDEDGTVLFPAAPVRRLIQDDPQCMALVASVASLETEAEVAPLEHAMNNALSLGETAAGCESLSFEGVDEKHTSDDISQVDTQAALDLSSPAWADMVDAFGETLADIQNDEGFETLLSAMETGDSLDILLGAMNQPAPNGRLSSVMRALYGDEEFAALLTGKDENEEALDTPAFTLEEIVMNARKHGDNCLLDAQPAILEGKLHLLCAMQILNQHGDKYSFS